MIKRRWRSLIVVSRRVMTLLSIIQRRLSDCHRSQSMGSLDQCPCDCFQSLHCSPISNIVEPSLLPSSAPNIDCDRLILFCQVHNPWRIHNDPPIFSPRAQLECCLILNLI
ncbi:hypothetical protein F4604DRAFT_1762458 [Suillus subluteus]|nr:hypothetical protein F4604DRAFT_1762458 [Suillus subluteus]